MTQLQDLPAIVDRLQDLYAGSVRDLRAALKAYLETGARPSAEDRARGLAAGARAHIDKREFHQGTLLDRISELLGE